MHVHGGVGRRAPVLCTDANAGVVCGCGATRRTDLGSGTSKAATVSLGSVGGKRFGWGRDATCHSIPPFAPRPCPPACRPARRANKRWERDEATHSRAARGRGRSGVLGVLRRRAQRRRAATNGLRVPWLRRVGPCGLPRGARDPRHGACVCVCVRARMRACERACACMCMRACVMLCRVRRIGGWHVPHAGKISPARWKWPSRGLAGTASRTGPKMTRSASLWPITSRCRPGPDPLPHRGRNRSAARSRSRPERAWRAKRHTAVSAQGTASALQTC